jgi:intracellular septation protein A
MLQIVITLVFSVVMLMFMAFPAMKIVEWLDSKFNIPEKWYNPLLISTTIFLSFCIALFLQFA